MTSVEKMRKLQQESLELFRKKNLDYGDAFKTFGSVGVIVRMMDKVQRMLSITKNGITYINNESLRDTLQDLSNYANMAIMVLDDELDSKNSSKPVQDTTKFTQDQYIPLILQINDYLIKLLNTDEVYNITTLIHIVATNNDYDGFKTELSYIIGKLNTDKLATWLWNLKTPSNPELVCEF